MCDEPRRRQRRLPPGFCPGQSDVLPEHQSSFTILAASLIGIPSMNWGIYFGLMAGWMMAIAMPTVAVQLGEEWLAFSSGGRIASPASTRSFKAPGRKPKATPSKLRSWRSGVSKFVGRQAKDAFGALRSLGRGSAPCVRKSARRRGEPGPQR